MEGVCGRFPEVHPPGEKWEVQGRCTRARVLRVVVHVCRGGSAPGFIVRTPLLPDWQRHYEVPGVRQRCSAEKAVGKIGDAPCNEPYTSFEDWVVSAAVTASVGVWLHLSLFGGGRDGALSIQPLPLQNQPQLNVQLQHFYIFGDL